jgi:hypothetical protein
MHSKFGVAIYRGVRPSVSALRMMIFFITTIIIFFDK